MPTRTATRRWALRCSLALIAATLPAPGVAVAATDPPFTWSLVSRFGGDPDGDGRLVGMPAGVSDRLTEHPVLIDPAPAVCAAGEGARWRVDGTDVTARVREPVPADGPPQSCAFIVNVAGAAARHRVEVRAGSISFGTDITVDDRIVVALGDSVASGEGNPVRGPVASQWLERRCHRSVAAGFEQAARLVAAGAPPTRSLTFVSLACSGATVRRGLLGTYRGIDPDGTSTLEPQVDRLRRLDGMRGVAAVLVSVGANDVFFGEVVQHCIERPACQGARFDPRGQGARRSADAEVGAALERLAGEYDDLGRELGSIVDEPGDVLMSEYFDPTKGSTGAFCSTSLPGVSAAEMRWASEALLIPLNFEVAAASRRLGWREVAGIGKDFARHGYCARPADRWVRTLSESFARQTGSPLGPRLSGTLHPNEKGHVAIAVRVAPRLADVLALAPAERPPPAELREQTPWLRIALAAAGALVALLLVALVLARVPLARWPATALRWLVRSPVNLGRALERLSFLVRSSGRDDPVTLRYAPPRPPSLRLSGSFKTLALQAAGLVVAAIVSVGFVAFVGAAIVYVRFWSARVPADQALAIVQRGELVVIGAQALVLFALLALVAVVVVWLFDGEGKAIRSTRRGLALLMVVELLAALLIADIPRRQFLILIAGFVAGVLLLHHLVDRALGLQRLVGQDHAGRVLVSRLGGFFVRPADEPEPARTPRLVVLAWRALPLLALAAAIVGARTARTEPDRVIEVFGPLLLAAALFFAPGGIAGRAATSHARSVEPVRVALATTLLCCLLILLLRDEPWLLGTAVVAALLAAACLAVAAASTTRFAPYGIAVLLSVPVFGAALAALRAVDSPEMQPAAVVLKPGERALCGVYVGERDDRLWLARIELAELGTNRRPRPRLGRLTAVERDQIAAAAVGPMQSVSRAQDQALILRDELLRERGRPGGGALPDQTCAANPPRPRQRPSRERTLAERFQPELVLDRGDGFWPVEVRTLFAMQDRRRRACRVLSGDLCIRLRNQGDLPWSGGDGESLEYPAADDQPGEQHDVLVDALGSVDPARTAREYFLTTGGEDGRSPVSLQYWFFYTFNYQPLAVGRNAGYHEGDFESVGVLLSARSHRPRFVWMARHDDEGRVFVWDEDVVEKSGDSPRVFVARGSHASYESCDRQSRPKGPGGLIDDRPSCDPLRQLHIGPEATPLTDLSRVPWGCWRGLFGHRREQGYEESARYLVADAPRSPLWQQRFDDTAVSPCTGIRDPGRRDAPHEEVLPDDVATRIRSGAGRLEALVDECSDWRNPPVRGAYLVVCDSDALRTHLESGLEEIDPDGVRIDVADSDDPVIGAVTVPAVRRDRFARRLDSWRIVSGRPTQVEIYAACQSGNDMLLARFVDIPLAAGQPLRVDDRARTIWRLRTENGTTVARATPAVIRGAQKQERTCGA